MVKGAQVKVFLSKNNSLIVKKFRKKTPKKYFQAVLTICKTGWIKLKMGS